MGWRRWRRLPGGWSSGAGGPRAGGGLGVGSAGPGVAGLAWGRVGDGGDAGRGSGGRPAVRPSQRLPVVRGTGSLGADQRRSSPAGSDHQDGPCPWASGAGGIGLALPTPASDEQGVAEPERGGSPPICGNAWKAPKRWHGRLGKLLGRGKNPGEAITGVAREWTGLVWAIAREVELVARGTWQFIIEL
jgi:hypothetical protein